MGLSPMSRSHCTGPLIKVRPCTGSGSAGNNFSHVSCNSNLVVHTGYTKPPMMKPSATIKQMHDTPQTEDDCNHFINFLDESGNSLKHFFIRIQHFCFSFSSFNSKAFLRRAAAFLASNFRSI